SVIIVQAVAAALMAAEERKIVHRDIKPDNIMFTRRGEVKLADLGIAKNDEEDNELTKTNVMIGTPAYLSPEQVQNAKAVDIRADIYSLGASFYEMLTGQHPYPGENTYEILHKLFADPVPDPRKITPEISAATADIVMKMLAKDAKDRFQNVAELITVMDKTFPHHTAMESAELIKKAISGICEENVTFSSGITVTGLGAGGRRVWLKKLAFAGIVISLLFTGGIYSRLVFGERGRGYMKFTKPDGKINDFGVKNIASESFSGLTFKTIPHGEIKLTASDGGVQLFSADENGFLEIPNFRNGKYQVKISGKNFIPFEKNIDLLNDIILEAKLIKDVKSLKIRATPNAKLKLSGIENPDRELLVPGSGILEVGDLVSDTILIRCEAAGYETYEQSLVLNKDSELLIDGRPIKNVLKLKTVPLAGVVLKRGEKIFFTAQSDALGNCCIEGIPFGVYQLHISNNDYEPLISECDLTSDKNITLLPKKIAYDIVVKSLAGAQIRLLKDNQLQGTFFVPESGILKLTALPKGEYAILADKDGFDNEQLDFFVDKSQTIKCPLKEKIVVQGYNSVKNIPAVSPASTGETTA
ncbi:MAG: serine/threonine-protein kinase, partial [Victivallaceae bacterium]